MRHFAFSKLLIVFETALVAITTWQGFTLAHEAVGASFTGTLPWIAAMVTGAWGAYGASAAFYYNKSKAENTAGGIVYDSAVNRDC